jgi:hypothetical protein
MTVVVAAVAALLTGCVNWQVHTMKPTPQNMQAYRECQRTFATAVRLDVETKKACLATIDWTTQMVSSPSVPKGPPGCQTLEWFYYQVYQLCR